MVTWPISQCLLASPSWPFGQSLLACGDLATPRLETKVQFPGLGKEDTPEPLVIPGGGLARRLLAACQDRGMQVLDRSHSRRGQLLAVRILLGACLI